MHDRAEAKYYDRDGNELEEESAARVTVRQFE
jgi:hypothetical protein